MTSASSAAQGCHRPAGQVARAWAVRMLLSRRHFGYEVATEGDAFVLAFHGRPRRTASCI